jgi:uncharacterized coiled-coil protein SlyX
MTRTETERLTALETSSAMHFGALMDKLDEISGEVRALRKDLDEQTAKLAAMENKGKGVLIGVGIAGTGLGAWVSSILEWFK